MKALAGMLLAVALAMGVGEASAQSCPMLKRNAKPVAKTSIKKTKTCGCRIAKSNKSKVVMTTRSYSGYMPGTDTTTAPREGMIDFRSLGIDRFRNSEIPARDPINNGGSLQARMDGAGGLEPRTITNGMEWSMSGSR